MRENKYLALALSDLLIVFAILYALVVMYCGWDVGILFSDKGVAMLRYYTVDANFLAGISCLFCLPFELRAWRHPERGIPNWANLLKFTGVVCLALTFLVVALFLGPMFGLKKVTEGSNLFMHFVIPVWFVGIWIWSREGAAIRKRQLPVTLLPTLLYAAVYLVRLFSMEQIVTGAMDDWYGFGQWGKALLLPMTAFLFVALYGLARLLWRVSGGRRELR